MKRFRVSILLLVFALVLSLAFLFWKRSTSTRETISDPVDAKLHQILARSIVVKPPVPKAKQLSSAPIIDSIVVEKEEVCEGEENLVTVKAHIPDSNSNPFLNYVVGGIQGSSVPVKAFVKRSDGSIPTQTILVFGKSGPPTVADIPRYSVKHCEVPAATAKISARELSNTVDQFEFFARVDGFQPRSYQWDFGDGEKASTTAPTAFHNYARRMQRSLYSFLLVQVKATNEENSASARLSFTLRNPAFEEWLRGRVAIFAEPSERFSKGNVQSWRIFHTEDSPVEITKLTAVWLGRSRTESRELDLSVLARTDIPPGEGFVQELSVPEFEPDFYGVNYFVEGISSDGRPGKGLLSILKPPPRPTKENSIPISEPAMLTKLRKALAIVGQNTISKEELDRLDREGRLK